MKLTQGQVRAATGLTEPTLRVWGRHVPHLRALKGKGLNFTLGDLIALLVLESAAKQLGCPISFLAPRSAELFDTCRRLQTTGARSGCIVIRSDTVTLSPNREHLAAEPMNGPFIVVPLAPIFMRLDRWMNQGQLTLPL